MSTKVTKFPHVYTEGDTLPPIPTVRRGVNLTGFTITLRMARNSGIPLVKTPLLIVDALQGEFLIEWATTDLVPGLDQGVDIEFVDPSGVQTSKRILIDVKEKIQ